jgi:rfaE bifunctional protein kinase chain/domain/rfaE bifunctional protein nucleotidyltransferase chain/domain
MPPVPPPVVPNPPISAPPSALTGAKIVTLPDLLAMRMAARNTGKTVVHCHGCFDIVHPGHIQHLQYARSLGDLLVVSVSADTHVGKGVNRPLIPDDLRAGSLAALACVDYVYVNDTPTAVELLGQLRPDIFVKGREYETSADPRFLAERDAVIRGGGRVIFASGEIIYSSTALISSLSQTAAFDAEKLSRFRQRFELTPDALRGRMRAMHGRRAVVIGDYIRDRYTFCHATGVASESPIMSLQAQAGTDYDGGAAIIAQHLAALGAETTLLTTLPADEAAALAARLAPLNIAVRAVPTRSDAIVKERYLVDSQKIVKIDHGRPAPTDSAATQELARTVLDVAGGADLVVFADFGYGTLSPALLDLVLPTLRETVGTISADVSGRASTLAKFRGVDLLCPTERELRESMQDFASSLNAVAWNFLERTAARQLIVTLGKQGVLVLDRPPEDPAGRLRAEHIPAIAPYAIDPLGCGDAFLATTSLALCAEGTLQAAALLGSLAAAHHCQQLGNPALDVTAISGMVGTLPVPSLRMAG